MGRRLTGSKRFFSPRFLFFKLREKGIRYCVSQVVLRLLLPLRILFRDFYERLKPAPAGQNDNVLYAFYDLEASPATFDIVTFLILAEIARQKTGCEYLNVVIVPGSHSEGLRYDCSVDSEKQRINNILVPCCSLLPSCKGAVTVCSTRQQAQTVRTNLAKYVFPARYSPKVPQAKFSLKNLFDFVAEGYKIPSIQAGSLECNRIDNWITRIAGGKKVISITLREASYEQDRNSDLKAWGRFARSLNGENYFPVVIRDLEKVFEPLPPELDGLTVLPEFSLELRLRAALYEKSYINFFVNSGPANLCYMNSKTRCLVFKMLVPSCPWATEDYFYKIGLLPGSQYPTSTPFQRTVWADDTFEVIKREFEKMCMELEDCSND